MPAASSKPDNKGSHEPLDPMKNAILVIEKKVRNLEKRKGKLDAYREMRDGGDKLNKDQQEAVDKYDSVLLNLEFARELQKQFLIIQGESEKLMKKQAKKERLAQQAQEIKKVQEVLQLQNTLDNMGGEDVRENFLNGTAGAVKLTQAELDHLDELYKLISPTREGESSYQDQLTHASEHIANFLEAKEKEVAGTTYKALKDLVGKIIESGYFDKSGETEETPKEEEAESPAVTEPVAEESTGNVVPEAGETYRPNEVSAPVEQPEIHTSLLNHEPVSTHEEPVVSDPHHNPHIGGHPVAPVNYTPEEESFFSTEAFPQPRPFQEIVSSVQGTFNFLQESQIMNEVAASDPAVIAATSTSLAHPDSHLVQPVSYKSNSLLTNDSGLASVPTQSTAVSSMPADSLGGASDHSGAVAVPPGLVSQQQQPHDTYGSSGQDYFMASSQQQQPNASSGLSFMSEQMGGMDPELGAASEVPPAIPMPNQTAMNMGGGGEAAQEQMSEMNPNAKMFRSMYSGGGQGQSGGGSNGGYSQSGAVGEENFSQGHDYQGYGSNGYGQRRGRGGPRGGSGNRGGMSNGYSRGGRSSNPNGGYGGGRRDGGYSNGNSRGTGNRGSRGGPPRGGQIRGGGRGMSGGFSGPRGNTASQASSA